jgi:DNA-directed RNA polymerase specialized sigma24 family protein
VQDAIYKNLFAELIKNKLPLLRRVAVNIVNSPVDADDVVQNAFLLDIIPGKWYINLVNITC